MPGDWHTQLAVCHRCLLLTLSEVYGLQIQNFIDNDMIFIDCEWVSTPWQWFLFVHQNKNEQLWKKIGKYKRLHVIQTSAHSLNNTFITSFENCVSFKAKPPLHLYAIGSEIQWSSFQNDISPYLFFTSYL